MLLVCLGDMAELLPLFHRWETEAGVFACWWMEAHKEQASAVGHSG